MARSKLVPFILEPTELGADNYGTRYKYANFFLQNEGTPSSKSSDFDGRAFIGQAFKINHIPEEALNGVLAFLRPATIKQYTSELKKWSQFC